MATYKCKVCGEAFASTEANPVCPRCKQSGDKLEIRWEDEQQLG